MRAKFGDAIVDYALHNVGEALKPFLMDVVSEFEGLKESRTLDPRGP